MKELSSVCMVPAYLVVLVDLVVLVEIARALMHSTFMYEIIARKSYHGVSIRLARDSRILPLRLSPPGS